MNGCRDPGENPLVVVVMVDDCYDCYDGVPLSCWLRQICDTTSGGTVEMVQGEAEKGEETSGTGNNDVARACGSSVIHSESHMRFTGESPIF